MCFLFLIINQFKRAMFVFADVTTEESAFEAIPESRQSIFNTRYGYMAPSPIPAFTSFREKRTSCAQVDGWAL